MTRRRLYTLLAVAAVSAVALGAVVGHGSFSGSVTSSSGSHTTIGLGPARHLADAVVPNGRSAHDSGAPQLRGARSSGLSRALQLTSAMLAAGILGVATRRRYLVTRIPSTTALGGGGAWLCRGPPALV